MITLLSAFLTQLSGGPLLLDLALKSVVLLLLASVAAWMLRHSSAALRHLVWSVALAGLLVLPVLALALPSWRVELLPQPLPKNTASAAKAELMAPPLAVDSVLLGDTVLTEAEFAAPSAPVPADATAALAEPVVTASAAPSLKFSSKSLVLWQRTVAAFTARFHWKFALLLVWIAGMLLVLGRVALGTARVWWLTRAARQVTERSWLALARHLAASLRLRSHVRLLKSSKVEMPMTWGAWRSVVLLPAEADMWSDGCRSIVLLHELAHIKRRDCLTQALAQLACAVYWFNPLVWLAARRLREERELACDDYVLGVGTKASDYATHLVEIAGGLHARPQLSPVAVGMACSQLENRVRAILDPQLRRSGLSRQSVLWAAVGVVALVAPLSALQPWAAAQAAPAAEQASAHFAQLTPGFDASQTQSAPAGQTPQSTSAQHAQLPTESRETQTTQTQTSEVQQDVQTTLQLELRQGLLQELKHNLHVDLAKGIGQGLGQGIGQGLGHGVGSAVGQQFGNSGGQGQGQTAGQRRGQNTELTVDQVIQMKTHNVTPEFIESIRRAGFANASVRELVESRIHGIDENYIQQVRGWGFENVTLRDLMQLRIAGVTPDYLSSLKQAGYTELTLRQVANMRLHGVTPEFAASLRQFGYDKLTADQLTQLKIHGINDAFIKEAQTQSGEKLSINDLVQFKISGASPEYARQLRALGFNEVPLRKLTQLSLHGVTPAYVQEMRELGFDNLTLEQLLKMRIHGVTSEYVKKMRATGLKNVSLNQLIEMKISGVDQILLKNAR